MAGTVVTIVGSGLYPDQVCGVLKTQGVGNIDVSILAQGYAADFFIEEDSLDLKSALYNKFLSLGAFDVFIQPNDGFRKKKLLIADMDATIVRQETLDELANCLGLRDKIAPITQKAMRGELDFHEAINMRVALLAGMHLEKLYSVLNAIEYSKGAQALVKAMNSKGAKTVLVSGGFDVFTNSVAQALGFSRNFGNRLEVVEQKLSGKVIPPILDKDSKEKILIEQAKELGCDLKYVVAVGDGSNDIPMLKKAGVGVGYFAKPAVIEATPYQIRYTGLEALLYMQGYRQSEFCG